MNESDLANESWSRSQMQGNQGPPEVLRHRLQRRSLTRGIPSPTGRAHICWDPELMVTLPGVLHLIALVPECVEKFLLQVRDWGSVNMHTLAEREREHARMHK